MNEQQEASTRTHNVRRKIEFGMDLARYNDVYAEFSMTRRLFEHAKSRFILRVIFQ